MLDVGDPAMWTIEAFPQYSAQPFVHIVIDGQPMGEGGRLIAVGPNGKVYGYGDSGVVLPDDYQDLPGEYVYFLSIGGDTPTGQEFHLFFSPDDLDVFPLYPPYIFTDLDFSTRIFHN